MTCWSVGDGVEYAEVVWFRTIWAGPGIFTLTKKW